MPRTRQLPAPRCTSLRLRDFRVASKQGVKSPKPWSTMRARHIKPAPVVANASGAARRSQRPHDLTAHGKRPFGAISQPLAATPRGCSAPDPLLDAWCPAPRSCTNDWSQVLPTDLPDPGASDDMGAAKSADLALASAGPSASQLDHARYSQENICEQSQDAEYAPEQQPQLVEGEHVGGVPASSFSVSPAPALALSHLGRAMDLHHMHVERLSVNIYTAPQPAYPYRTPETQKERSETLATRSPQVPVDLDEGAVSTSGRLAGGVHGPVTRGHGSHPPHPSATKGAAGAVKSTTFSTYSDGPENESDVAYRLSPAFRVAGKVSPIYHCFDHI